MVLKFDPQRVQANVRKASTEDLLDRLTAFRASLEPEALAMIEEELKLRGVEQIQIQVRAARAAAEEVIQHTDGTAATCSFCRKPAVARTWGWHRLWKKIPLFPRLFNYCAEHRPLEN